jgi:hypothetical protein
MVADRWELGRSLYVWYQHFADHRTVDWDNLALFQKETYQRTAERFAKEIEEKLDPRYGLEPVKS